MVRRSALLLVAFAALAVVPPAFGAYPAPFAVQGGDGVLGADGSTRFVALKAGGDTLVKAVRTGRRLDRALSPDGSRLYLIQHTSVDDLQHYVVRAYDLATHTLLPGRVADKTQKSWVMQGWAVSRATTADGRWDYTLYANPGGYPFIHALDTVRGVAHCIGLPWSAGQDPVWSFTLVLDGKTLAVKWKDGRTWRRVDTTTWRITKP